MAKGKGFGGFGGGMNMQAMMKQAQKMQESMLKAQEEIAQMESTGTAGGGMVTATVTGTSTLKVEERQCKPLEAVLNCSFEVFHLKEHFKQLKTASWSSDCIKCGRPA